MTDKYQQGSKRSINDDLEREPRSIKISLPKTPWTQIHLRHKFMATSNLSSDNGAG